MTGFPEGPAIVYCEGAFATPNGKAAHGLVRRSRRYRIAAVVDSVHAGRDAGQVLDGRDAGIPVVESVAAAIDHARRAGSPATHYVVGIAPDGGRLSGEARDAVKEAVRAGLHVDCGLHDFLSEDREVAELAAARGVRIRDVRKPPPRDQLHFFTGRISEVESLRVALLGTDSAVGKRTTAWLLVDALEAAGHTAEMIGTGQTAWMQGVTYGIVMDSIVSDFVSGEIEHAILRCWDERRPRVMVLEGQGSLMNPAYPGGLELLAAGRPHVVVVQHAPARTFYDGFPGFALHPLDRQIHAIEALSESKVVAVTVNHEGLTDDEARRACERIREQTGLPAVDVLLDGASALVDVLRPHVERA